MRKLPRLQLVVAVLPIVALTALIVYRKIYGPVQPPPMEGRPATESNPKYRELEAIWLTKKFSPLSDKDMISDNIAQLGINSKSPISSGFDREHLNMAIESVLKSMLVQGFEEYRYLRSANVSFTLDEHVLQNYTATLKQVYLKQGEAVPSGASEILRTYWGKVTREGALDRYWEEISWDSSWIWVESAAQTNSLQNTEDVLPFLINTFPNCGLVLYPSVFRYNPQPAQILARQGTILNAFAYLLLKTSDKDKAYPIMVHFYWEPETKAWLPLHFAVGYIGLRQIDPVF